jgi:hypothetical protein
MPEERPDRRSSDAGPPVDGFPESGGAFYLAAAVRPPARPITPATTW